MPMKIVIALAIAAPTLIKKPVKRPTQMLPL
jgi:hypothetical protein